MKNSYGINRLRKDRNCSFCGKPIECDCIIADWGVVKLDNSGDTVIEFDACDDCLKDLKKFLKDKFKKEEA